VQDVLGHSHTRVFVSHCGLHSVYEAGFHGVPVVGVPFMFEQVTVNVYTVSKLAHVRRHSRFIFVST
jgi:glucuronosyltransferase